MIFVFLFLIICKYFLPICGFFSFVYCFFCCCKGKFWWALMLVKFIYSLVLFYDLIKKCLTIQELKIHFPVSHQKLYGFNFTFWSMIHCRLTYLYIMKHLSTLIFLQYGWRSSWYSTKSIFFSQLNCFDAFIEYLDNCSLQS